MLVRWFALAVFVAFLCFAISPCTSIRVISPPRLSNHSYTAPVYSRFFGPHTNYTRSGLAQYYSGNVCHPIGSDFAGQVLVTKYANAGACSLGTRYLNMWASGAIACIEVSTFPVPGSVYSMQDGDKGRNTKHKSMVWLETNENAFSDVLDVLSAGKEEVWLEITVDINEWAKVYSVWHFTLVVRVLLPILLISTSCYAAFVLFRIVRGEVNAMRPTKIVVLAIESCCLLLSGLFLAMEGMYADDTLAAPAIWFFGTGFFGCSMFTTVCVATFYHSLNRATSTFTLVRNSLHTHRFFLAATFVVFVGMDLSIGTLFALYEKATLNLAIGSAMFTLGNLVAGVFLIVEKERFRRHIIKENKKWESNKRPPVMVQMCQHLGRWLIISAVFMFLVCIGTPMIAFDFSRTIPGFLILTPLMFFFRWGISFTQIQALAWNPNTKPTTNSKTKRKTKWVQRWRRTNDSSGFGEDGSLVGSVSDANARGRATSNSASSTSGVSTSWRTWKKFVFLRNPPAGYVGGKSRETAQSQSGVVSDESKATQLDGSSAVHRIATTTLAVDIDTHDAQL